MANLEKDSKTFVDQPLKFSEASVLQNFYRMMSDANQNPSKERVQV